MQEFFRDREFLERISKADADRFRIRALDFVVPAAKESVIQQMVEWLASEFESLRAVFVLEQASLGVRFLGEVRFPIQYEAVSNLHEALARKDHQVAEAREIVDLLAGIPFIVRVHNYGESHMLVRILCSHLAMDFATYRLMRVSVSEWFSGTYHNAGERPTYSEWMNDYFTYAVGERSNAERQEWARWPKAIFESTRAALDLRSGSDLARSTLSLSPVLVSALRNICRTRLKCRIGHAVAAILAAAFGEAFDLDDVALTWTTHGRAPVFGRSFHAVPGWLSSLHPLYVRHASSAPELAVDALQEALARCPRTGCAYSWLERFVADDQWRELTQSLATPIRVNIRESTDRAGRIYTTRKSDREIRFNAIKPHHHGSLHFHVVVDISSAITISIRTACDRGDSACRRLTYVIGSVVDRFLSIRNS